MKEGINMPKVGVFAAVFDESNRILCAKMKSKR